MYRTAFSRSYSMSMTFTAKGHTFYVHNMDKVCGLNRWFDLNSCFLVPLSCSIQNFCHKYKEFDPMLNPPVPSNPWVTGDTTLWTLENSL